MTRRSPRAVITAGILVAYAAWCVWTREGQVIDQGYAVVVLAGALTWGVGWSRWMLGRASGGAAVSALLAAVVAFLGMRLPNERLAALCAPPHGRCEDFSAVILLYALPFAMGLAALLAVLLHALSWLAVRVFGPRPIDGASLPPP